MEKIFNKAFLILMLHANTSTLCFATEKPERQGHSNCKIEINESTRGSPPDANRYSIKPNGLINKLILNEELIVTNSDSTCNKNKILVEGTGNTISIIQTDQESKLSITQKGHNNRISITQK